MLRKSLPLRNNEFGATMVEGAIAIPILIIIVFCTLEFGRILMTQGLLRTAAQEALSAAVIIPGVEGDPSEHDAAKADIEQKVYEFLSSTFVSTTLHGGSVYISDVDVAVASPGPSQRSQLERDPITITVTAELDTHFPLVASQTITAMAAGFREPRSEVARAVPIDCNGREVGHEKYNKGCPCADSKATRNPASNECECANNLFRQADGSCGCPAEDAAGNEIKLAHGDTVCACKQHYNHHWDKFSNTCVCRPDRVQPDGSCGDCPQEDWGKPGALCDTCPATAPYVMFTGYCSRCPNWSKKFHSSCLGQGKYVKQPANPGEACYCDGCASGCSDQNNMVQDPNTCACTCKGNYQPKPSNPKFCECGLSCASGEIPDDSCTACIEDTNPTEGDDDPSDDFCDGTDCGGSGNTVE